MSSIKATVKKVKGSRKAPFELAVHIDGKELKLPLDRLADDEFATATEESIASADKRVIVSLTALLIWPPEQRLTAIDFLASVKAELTFYVGRKRPKANSLFDAVLALLVDTQDLARFSTAKSAALETAVIMHEDALDGACDRIAKRYRELGVRGINRRDLLRDAHQIARDLNRNDAVHDDGGQAVVRSIEDAPVSADVVVPRPWKLTSKGISKDGEAIIVAAPVLITKRHQHVDEGTELLTLAWKRDGEWRERTVDRGVTANSRLIVDELAAYGLPVNSNNAKTLIQFLGEYEAENLARIPAVQVSRRLGWQGKDGRNGFLWGRQLIAAKGATKRQPQAEAIQFRGSDEGDEQIAAGFVAGRHIREVAKRDQKG
jgi:hypothetical protein